MVTRRELYQTAGLIWLVIALITGRLHDLDHSLSVTLALGVSSVMTVAYVLGFVRELRRELRG